MNDEYGRTAVHRACSNGSLEELKDIAEREGMDSLCAITNDGYTIFHLIIAERHAGLLGWILKNTSSRALVNHRDNRSIAPIHMVCNNGELEMLKDLLATQMVDLNVGNADGKTAFHLACRNHHTAIVIELLNHCKGNDEMLTQCDREGLTPLHCAVMVPTRPAGNFLWRLLVDSDAEQLISLLCSRVGVNINAVSKAGYTPLILASKQGHTAAVRRLLRFGANTSTAGAFGATALHEAVQWGHLDVVVALLQAGASTSLQDDDGLTPLHYSVTAMQRHLPDHLKIVDALVVMGGANVNAKDHSSATPLIKSCFHVDGDNSDAALRFVSRLLAHKADPTVEFDHGWNALHVISNSACPKREALLAQMLALTDSSYVFDAHRPRVVDNRRFHSKRGRWNRIPVEIRNDVLRGQVDLQGIASRIKEGRSRKIIVMCGAGISTSVGIPDFRSENGLYNQKHEKNRAMFDYEAFARDPQVLYQGVKDVFLRVFDEGPVKLSAAHRFISLLEKNGLLVRVYDQNVDGLTVAAVGNPGRVRECHGTLGSSRCSRCHKPSDSFWAGVREDVVAKCATCNGAVRPNVLFFGEGLPEAFTLTQFTDFKEADMLMVLGTSLTVYPFASLVSQVDDLCPRILFNRERVGVFTVEGSYRDVFAGGDIDASIMQLVQLLGWEDEFRQTPDRVQIRL